MTEEVKPKGTPYGLAMSLLQEFADTLPQTVVFLPDHVLWQSHSPSIPGQSLKLLDQAAAVLSALHARHIPLALLVTSDSIKQVKVGLDEARILEQFAAVVEYQQQQQGVTQAAQQDRQQLHAAQQPAAGSSWMDAAAAVKTQTGVAWQQMLMFCPSAAVDAVRLANKLGIACVRVAASGLNVAALRDGLQTYSSKLESDRGY